VRVVVPLKRERETNECLVTRLNIIETRQDELERR